jgi:NAD(P)-dependent dehydrogenase (short-subunit alcohol dehydrogenase family)
MSPPTTIVLITGANQGVGYEIAKKLSTDQPSYHIFMGSRNEERGVAAAAKLMASNVEAITIDVTSDTSIAAAAATIESKFGRLDVLINNAGIAIDSKYQTDPSVEVPTNCQPTTTSIRDVMRESYDTNVFGAIQTLETFIPLMEMSSLPRVVFLTSDLGSLGTNMEAGNYKIYRSTKTALNMLMISYASIYKKKGWKINATCPGYVKTNLNHYYGPGDPSDGAINAVRLATLGEDGETGTVSNKEGPLVW